MRLLTTACCIKELEELRALDPGVYGALMVTKTFPVYKCGHKEARSAQDCVLDLVTRPGARLVVATQDTELR